MSNHRLLDLGGGVALRLKRQRAALLRLQRGKRLHAARDSLAALGSLGRAGAIAGSEVEPERLAIMIEAGAVCRAAVRGRAGPSPRAG